MNIEFTPEMILAISASAFSLFGMLAAVFAFRQYRVCRGLLEFTGQQIAELDNSANGLNDTIESYKSRTADQSRRIAWLESRIRQPKLLREEVISERELAPAEPMKWNMTERRHHVLKLAARGQSADTIAVTLGMLPGEVELIINLNRANYAAA
jgi:hypothetical protein